MIDFDEIPISTSTIIGITNMNVNLEHLFYTLPIYGPKNKHHELITITESKIESFKNTEVEKQPERCEYSEGDIIYLRYNDIHRGYSIKKRKSSNFFRNTLTIIIFVRGKRRNLKVFTAPNEGSGNKIQQPGCKSTEDCAYTFGQLWKHIDRHCQYILLEPSSLSPSKISPKPKPSGSAPRPTLVLQVEMSNINFNLNFKVNREKLDRVINENQFHSYNSLLHPNFGHTGVNISVPINEPLTNYHLDKYTIIQVGEGVQIQIIEKGRHITECAGYEKNDLIIEHTLITFDEFIDNYLQEMARNRVLRLLKSKTNTFLVFYSGKVIMSGFIPRFMKTPYQQFYQLLQQLKPEIEETNA